MAKSYPIVEEQPGGVIVVARNTVEAQQAAEDALGGDCTITSVERIQQGGIGGFFATELVRVTATPSRLSKLDRDLDAAFSSAEELVNAMRDRSPQFADRLLDEWRQTTASTGGTAAAKVEPASAPAHEAPSASAQGSVALRTLVELTDADPDLDDAPHTNGHVVEQRDVQAMLQERRAQHVDAAPAPVRAPAPLAVPAAVERATRPQRASDSRWSPQALKAIGLPDALVDRAAAERPDGESEWIVAMISALRTTCSPAPAVPTVLIGPASANLARQMRLVNVGAEELAETLSSVAVSHLTPAVARYAMNDRLVHLVVGGAWRHLNGVQPHIVSAARTDDLLEALRVAFAWEARLGWYWAGERYERLDEFTVIGHIRGLLSNSDRTVDTCAEPVLVP